MDLCTTCLQLNIVFNLSGLDNSFMFLEGRSTSKVPRLIPDICYPHLIGGFSFGFIQRDSWLSVRPMEQVGAGGGRQGSSWAWVAGAGCGGASGRRRRGEKLRAGEQAPLPHRRHAAHALRRRLPPRRDPGNRAAPSRPCQLRRMKDDGVEPDLVTYRHHLTITASLLASCPLRTPSPSSSPIATIFLLPPSAPL